MTDHRLPLNFPASLSLPRRSLLTNVATRNAGDHGTDLLGMVLTGSAGRGIATERSDVDVYVVLSDAGIGQRETLRSAEIDEIPVPLSDLEQVSSFGSQGWYNRWSFAWAPILLDRTNGRLPQALHQLSRVFPDEAESILVEHDRLDGWLNYAYRALKNDRDGRTFERRLDSSAVTAQRSNCTNHLTTRSPICRCVVNSDRRKQGRCPAYHRWTLARDCLSLPDARSSTEE